MLSESDLISDYDRLYNAVLSNHPMPFADRDEFISFADAQRSKITAMSKIDFIKIISPVLSKVKCGHTHLWLENDPASPMLQGKHFLPLEIKVIENELFLYNDIYGNNIENGSKIISINNHSSSSIIKILYSSLSADGENVTRIEKTINSKVPFYYLYYVFIESPKMFKIKYSLPHSSDVNKISIKPVDLLELSEKYDSTMSKNDNNREIAYSINEKYAQLKISDFHYSGSDYDLFNRNITTFFTEIKSQNISNLILDLRGNYGGESDASRLLLTYLLEEPFQYFSDDTFANRKYKQISKISENSFTGKLYILIDGLSFSATGHLLSILKYQNRGIMIGQESGSGYISTSSKTITLPKSGIMFELGIRNHATDVQGQIPGYGIQPDIEVSYTISDYLKNSDLEMAIVLQEIENNT